MPVLDNWSLQLTIDQVLRAQGADPEAIRLRRPALVRTTEEALVKAQYLLRPKVLYQTYPVRQFVHERLELASPTTTQRNYSLSGQLIAQHLAKAESVVIMICTIGSELDSAVSSLFNQNPVAAVALDGVGSAAVETLSILASNYFEGMIRNEGLQTSMPLNPGMIGWTLETGQTQIFSLLDSDEVGVTLTDSFMMSPNKSLSIVLGIGKDVTATGSACTYCSLNGVCRYKEHYAN